ncbi:hypothetical protein EVAR_93422_1 [Eumeta japonica]|uniref:Uncharacterized protein n=1 Tax=Eumeta variegata TaxID=151549 RepID=A0A4C1UPX2_EUMVA|nr:hypothetical protein EVAR_93422_1 [Eumeta japonica]
MGSCSLIFWNENWKRQKKNESRINAVEIRSLRTVCGASRKDISRNSDVKERCGLKEEVVTRVERVQVTLTRYVFHNLFGRRTVFRSYGRHPPMGAYGGVHRTHK